MKWQYKQFIIKEKTKVVAEKGYDTVKEGTLTAWNFFKNKINELQKKEP